MHTPVVTDLDAEPLPALVELLHSEHAHQRADAACAMGDRIRTRELLHLEPDVQNVLAKLLTDSVPMVQLEAAIALAEVQDVRATDILLWAMTRRMFRLDATRALGTLGDPRAIPKLTQLMQSRLLPWADRLQAAAALCALGDPGGAAYLKDKMISRRYAERAAALHFLGESKHQDALTLLSDVLSTPLHPLRDVAARALGLLGDPNAVDVLQANRAGAETELCEDIDAALELLRRTL